MLRKLFMLICAGGGVYGAVRLTEWAAKHTTAYERINPWHGESLLLMVPLMLVGALFGAFIGGIIIPRRLN